MLQYQETSGDKHYLACAVLFYFISDAKFGYVEQRSK